ncbi:MAG: type II toxin-antitoxin system HipA family toxin [Alkalispirochaeta sp.]
MTVWYHSETVGHLQSDEQGGFRFAYAQEWLHRKNAFPISLSLPLGDAVDQGWADAWFSNLLPEGPGKEDLCRQLGVSPDNRYELLRAIGQDCAGALVITDRAAEPGLPRYQEFSADQLRYLIKNRPALPVLNSGEYVRFSLAGSASKWAVVFDNERFYWPLDSAASTHILKVYDPRFSHGSYNEAFTAFLAAKIGLSVVTSTPTDEYLLIERYDRKREKGTNVRIHQEDMAQALGVPPFRKYQREGGVGIAQVIELIRNHSWKPLQDQRSVITWHLGNLILGNSDGHLKNISVLYDGPQVNVAPFYDMVCTRNYEGVERNLALHIGGGADPGHIGREHFSAFALETGIGERYYFQELDRIMQVLEEGLDDFAHDFGIRWGTSPVIDRITRIVKTQIRRTKTLVRR